MPTLSMSTERTDHNPSMPDSEAMDHWYCTLRYGTKRMPLVFSMGSAHHAKAPTLDDVMGCLAMDASSVDNARNFEDWAAELGYDTDSRKAEATYRACVDQVAKLRNLLGGDYATVLKTYADA
jgi:hypothetical protein